MARGSDTLDSMKPLVDRALNDDDLRKNVSRALRAAQKVYRELSSEDGLGAARKVARSSGVRDDLDTAVQNLSEAMVRVSGHKPRRSGSWAPFLLLALAGFALFNPATGASTRRWLKDHLFGSEEEFDYASPEYDALDNRS